MVADYLLAGKKWSGPREGVNLAGYIAWAVGFIVGILPLDVLPITLSPEMKSYVQPAVVYSFIVGFVVYFALAKAGLQPKAVSMPKAA
jgi:cytosine permease